MVVFDDMVGYALARFLCRELGRLPECGIHRFQLDISSSSVFVSVNVGI